MKANSIYENSTNHFLLSHDSTGVCYNSLPYKSTVHCQHHKVSCQLLWSHTDHTFDKVGSCSNQWNTYYTVAQYEKAYSYTVLFWHHKLHFRQSLHYVHIHSSDSQELGHDHKCLANTTRSWDQQCSLDNRRHLCLHYRTHSGILWFERKQYNEPTSCSPAATTSMIKLLLHLPHMYLRLQLGNP